MNWNTIFNQTGYVYLYLIGVPVVYFVSNIIVKSALHRWGQRHQKITNAEKAVRYLFCIIITWCCCWALHEWRAEAKDISCNYNHVFRDFLIFLPPALFGVFASFVESDKSLRIYRD